MLRTGVDPLDRQNIRSMNSSGFKFELTSPALKNVKFFALALQDQWNPYQ